MYSTFATSCGVRSAPIRLRRTSGVWPTLSRIESLMSASLIAWRALTEEALELACEDVARRHVLRLG